jgi:flagellar biosynthesis protein FlhF
MRIKTFYSKSMSEALREIKANLGPDAILLSTREIPRRSGIWGRSSGFEVVAAIDHEDDVDVFSRGGKYASRPETTYSPKPDHSPEAETKAVEPANSKAPSRDPLPRSGRSAVALPKKRKSSQKRAQAEKRPVLDREEAAAEAAPEKLFPFKGRVPLGFYRDLLDCGVEASLASELLARALEYLTAGQRRSRPALHRAATRAALSLMAYPEIDDGMPGKKVVAFVGPTGVGKTTSIAKLAARLALKQKKKVLLVTLDGYRIGAVEQLRSYAGLMGIPFRFVEHSSDLAGLIGDNSQRDFILIDTAGRGPRDMEAMQGIADFLKRSDHIERHLVLSAATKSSDLHKIMDQFECCRPDHLLFTKLDETSTAGPILNELVRTQKLFSYYTDGQKVPDDLHVVPRESIMDIILNRNESALKE